MTQAERALARLQATPNTAVSMDELGDAIWPEGTRRPSTWRIAGVYVVMGNLRGAGHTIACDPGQGFRLLVPETVA